MSWLTDPDEEWSPEEQQQPHYTAAPAAWQPPPTYRTPLEHPEPPEPPEPRRSRLPLILGIVGAWLAVSLLVLGVLLVVRGTGGNDTATAGRSTGPSSSHAGSTAPASRTVPAASYAAPVLPTGWVARAADTQTNCAAHSYGEISDFLSKTPCTAVRRQIATTTQAGRQVVVASYVITFGTADRAASFNKLVAADGTGNISDLLREGFHYSGGPGHLSGNAAFASRQDGNRVHVAEAAWAKGDTHPSDSALGALAEQAVA